MEMIVKLRIIEREERNSLYFILQRGVVEYKDRLSGSYFVREWEEVNRYGFLNQAEAAYEKEIKRLSPNYGKVLKESEEIIIP